MAIPNNKPQSPLEALSLERFGGHTYGTEEVITVFVTRTTILRNNPNRVYWVMINEGANDIRVSFDPSITAVSGFVLAASGGIIICDWFNEGETVGYEVYGIAVGVDTRVRVREVIRS